ncbi:MAG: carboxypeptidase-like regulatory domain-containing protein [bacterium]
MRLITVVAAALPLFLDCAPLLAQQSGMGRLEGIVEEKIATRSVAAASVSLVPLATDGRTFNAHPDGFGHYTLDSLPAGRYLIQVSSPTLDSLELALPPKELKIGPGETAHADFSLPFGASLRDVVCTGLSLSPDKAVVAGRAIDADTDKPLVGADVVALWTEVGIDKKTLKSSQQRRITVVKSGPTGDYRLCGVPTGRWLSLQLQHSGRAGAAVRAAVSSEEGAAVRDLSMSPRSSPTITALDSLDLAAAFDSTSVGRAELQLTGTASLTGSVRGAEGLALSNVRVRVRDARSSDLTNAAGHFAITGLPAGTQIVSVQQLGYALTEIPVELRAGVSVTRDLQLQRVVSLDSIRVVAKRPQLAEFEDRRAHLAGRYMTATEIAARKLTNTPQLIQMIGGFKVQGTGNDAKLLSNLAFIENPNCRDEGANVIIDGRDGTLVNALHPAQIGGLEMYASASLAPAKYADRAKCGLIIMWTKQALSGGRKAPAPGSTLQYNGY